MKVNFNRLTDLYKNKKIDISECLSKVKFEYRHLSPAIYLYNKIISYNGNKFSKDFIELLYVTLDAWNMNSRAAKLSEFDDFKKSILDNKNLFKKLENLNIRNIEEAFDTLKDLYNNGSSCIYVGKRANLATHIGLSFRKTSSLKILILKLKRPRLYCIL